MNLNANTPDKQDEALKPCPFCGGAAILGMFNVWCSKCEAATGKFVDAEPPELIRHWNSRASVAAVEGDALAKAKAIVDEYKQRVVQLPSGDAVPCAAWLEMRLRIAFDLAAASSPAPAEPLSPCGPARPDDGSECAFGWCPKPRDGCSEYCVEHHESQCKPLQPTGEQECQLLGYSYDKTKEQRWCVTHNQPVVKCAATPPTTPSDAAMRAAEELADELFQHGTTLTPTVKGDPIGVGYSPRYFIDKVAAIITRHLAATEQEEKSERGL